MLQEQKVSLKLKMCYTGHLLKFIGHHTCFLSIQNLTKIIEKELYELCTVRSNFEPYTFQLS